MIGEQRAHEIAADPASATPAEVAELAAEVTRWRPVTAYVHETLKAIYINAKEAEARSLELDVIAAASRNALKRMKGAMHGGSAEG